MSLFMPMLEKSGSVRLNNTMGIGLKKCGELL